MISNSADTRTLRTFSFARIEEGRGEKKLSSFHKLCPDTLKVCLRYRKQGMLKNMKAEEVPGC